MNSYGNGLNLITLRATGLSNETVIEIKEYTERINILAEYKEKITGKRIDYDANGSYQCVDLVKSWYTKLTKQIAPQFNGSAYNAWKYGVQGLEPTETPIAGDIAFFKFKNLRAGHVGVFLFEENGYVWILHQNGGRGTGSGRNGDQVRVGKYPKEFLIGYKTFVKKDPLL